MHRIDTTNSTATNRFTDGPPGTVVDDGWLNAVQEEIANVIEGAGAALNSDAADSGSDYSNANQLLAAI